MIYFEVLAAAQYLLTAASSGFNSIYFLGYRTKLARRRVGALVLSLVSLATFAQSFYFTLLLLIGGMNSIERLLLNGRHWLVFGFMAMLGSFAISTLILRQEVFSTHSTDDEGDPLRLD